MQKTIMIQFFILFLPYVNCLCTTSFSIRKEIRNLSSAERDAFFNGFVNLMNSGQLDDMIWKHTNLNNGFANNVHYTPLFLPWHRLFLKELEDKLKIITNNVNFSIPYWDWTIDSQNPYNSPLLTKDYFGETNTVTGRVENWKYNTDSYFNVRVPSIKPLQRFYKQNYTFTHKLIVASLLNTSYSFSKMATNLENIPHANVHNFFNGDMNTLYSPNDPIFWMHHAFVDKLWYDWQSYNNNIYKFDTDSFLKLKDVKNTSFINNSYNNWTVASTLNSSELCIYYYDTSKSVFNSTQMTDITPPTIPFGWFESTGANISQVNQSINSVVNDTVNINGAINNNETLPQIPQTPPLPPNISGAEKNLLFKSSMISILIFFLIF